MKPTLVLTSSFVTLALMSAPAIAQQRVQDFTLPPGGTPTPSPTPEVEGPANEAAGVEIAPRQIVSPTPTPTSTPSPTPATVQPVREPSPEPSQPTAQPASSSSVSVPATTGSAITSPDTASTTPPPAADADIDVTDGANNGTASGSELPPLEPAARPAPNPEASTNDPAPMLPDWWPWAIGLFAALLAGAVGGWAFTRKRAVAAPAPIEPPIVPSSANQASSGVPIRADQIKTNIDVESLMRSVMMVTLSFKVQVANRQDRALRDVRVFADFASARRNQSMDQQMAGPHSRLEQIAASDRVGPQQNATLSGQLQMPIGEIEVFRQGQTPFCVPMLRLRLEAEGIVPQFHTFLIGLAALQPGGRVQPLPLSGPPGGYEGVQAKRLDTGT